MTRWMLPAVAVLAMALFAPADEPKKKNPFTDPSATPAVTKPEKVVPRIAHIKLSGDLDESPSAEALFGPPSENLMAKLNRIHKAATDDRVKALYLRIGTLDAGFGKLNELRH